MSLIGQMMFQTVNIAAGFQNNLKTAYLFEQKFIDNIYKEMNQNSEYIYKNGTETDHSKIIYQIMMIKSISKMSSFLNKTKAAKVTRYFADTNVKAFYDEGLSNPQYFQIPEPDFEPIRINYYYLGGGLVFLFLVMFVIQLTCFK
jgi:hypothetical protein